MKRSFLWVVLAALLVILGSASAGCGGGSSGSSGSNDGGNNGSYTNVRVTATLQSSGNFGVDPSNLAVGDQVQLRLLGVNSQGQTVQINGSNWTTNAPSSVATVTSSGLLRAVGPSNGANYTVSGRGPNGNVSAVLAVQPAQAFVSGLVRNVNGTGVGSVKVRFYTSGGTYVGQATTAANGTFRANVPSNTAKFVLDIETADPGANPIYYRQFEYTPPGQTETRSYLASDSTCRASIPALNEGTTTPISDIVLDDRASGPPPPPDGCLNG